MKNWLLKYEVLPLYACSIRLLIRSHLPTHTYAHRHPSSSSPASPYFTGKSAERAITVLQLWPSCYRDRLVWAIKAYYPCLSTPHNWLHIFSVCQPQTFTTRPSVTDSWLLSSAGSWKLAFRWTCCRRCCWMMMDVTFGGLVVSNAPSASAERRWLC